MNALGEGIDALYFDYGPMAGHAEDCPRHGSDVWEATRHQWSSYSGDRIKVTIRLACHDCGVVHFESAHEDMSTETTLATQIGYAARPVKVAGLWLWPGPRMWYGEEHGPVAYLITAKNERPYRPEDVLGKVGWYLGTRGGLRWSSGLGCTGYGPVITAAHDFGSRRAAVAWVAANASQTGGQR